MNVSEDFLTFDGLAWSCASVNQKVKLCCGLLVPKLISVNIFIILWAFTYMLYSDCACGSGTPWFQLVENFRCLLGYILAFYLVSSDEVFSEESLNNLFAVIHRQFPL